MADYIPREQGLGRVRSLVNMDGTLKRDAKFQNGCSREILY